MHSGQLLPKFKKSRRGGRPWLENHKVFESILWILRTGAPWADLPKQYGSGSTCWQRLHDWEEQDVYGFRRFASWMQDKGYIDKMPKIRKFEAAQNYGRCFELEEFEKLLKTTKAAGECFGLTGYQRYLLYLLACETGLRRGELRSLTVGAVDL